MEIDYIPERYNEYIGVETITREYKEFTFNSSGLNLNTRHAENYCMTNKFEFNLNVKNSLDSYFKNYLPKYVSGYLNAKIDGTFWIGVNDYGYVKGIPYQGNLSEKKIENKILKYVDERVNINKYKLMLLKKYLKIKLIKIERPNKPVESINPVFMKYMENKGEFMKRYIEYLELLENWRIRYSFFNQKLVDLINNKESRIMIQDYIRKYEPENPIIELLSTDYKMIHKNHDEICILRESKDNPYYWVCLWKDEMVELIRKERPIFREIFNYSIPINLIICCYDMIPYWFENNENMNLYVIQIKILFSEFNKFYKKIIKSFLICYMDNNKKIISCYRMILPNGEPTCIPLFTTLKKNE